MGLLEDWWDVQKLERMWKMSDDPMCKCGHRRGEHSEEQPYPCYGVELFDEFGDQQDDICDCESFEYVSSLK